MSRKQQTHYTAGLFIPAAIVTALVTASANAQQAATAEPAAGQVARLPRVAFEQYEQHRVLIRPGQAINPDDGMALWLTPVSSSLDLKAGGSASLAHLSEDGAMLGMEGHLSEFFVVGGVISVGESTAKFDDGGRFRLEGGTFSIYGGIDYGFGGVHLRLTKGGHEVKGIERVTGLDAAPATGETEARFWEIELGARTSYAFGAIEVTPGVSFAVGKSRAKSFVETGAAAGLFSFGSQGFTYKRLTLDSEIRGQAFALSRSLSVAPFATVAYSYRFGSNNYALDSAPVTALTDIRVNQSRTPARHRLDAGLGVELAVNERWFITAQYARQNASDIRSADRCALTLRVSF
ncbi:MAG: autotransporter outer membrane beta-barrel domain-containing protein [Gammaproteobacteria bacterium]|nr:autotransporter outer membrane beta-barrel domain-containing protein [Gammaproteobacteria bacterium]